MKTNGSMSTLATKGNEKEIGRKLEPETRSAGEYSHIEKHCFQKNDTNIMGTGSAEFISVALASITTAEMGDSRGAAITHRRRRRAPQARPPAPSAVGPQPGPPVGPQPGPPGRFPAPGKRVSPAPVPRSQPRSRGVDGGSGGQVSPAPVPTPDPAGPGAPPRAPSAGAQPPPPAREAGRGQPARRRTSPSSRALPLEGAMLSWKTWACFSQFSENINWEHGIMTKTSISQIKHND